MNSKKLSKFDPVAKFQLYMIIILILQNNNAIDYKILSLKCLKLIISNQFYNNFVNRKIFLISIIIFVLLMYIVQAIRKLLKKLLKFCIVVICLCDVEARRKLANLIVSILLFIQLFVQCRSQKEVGQKNCFCVINKQLFVQIKYSQFLKASNKMLLIFLQSSVLILLLQLEQWPDFGCEGIKVQRAHQPTSQCQGKKNFTDLLLSHVKSVVLHHSTILVFNSINQLRNQLKILDYYAYTQNCCFVRKNLVQIYEDEFLLNIAILRVVKFDFFFLSVCFELQVGEKMYKQTINNSAPLYNQHQ
eukprot:TRINITY_DN15372_c0_g1_i10.p1 TRINITY_DN15372_c0_g1~~TRINITY_DN15372_c0_g1_i10.p1  ORF type:complete len:303 (-),score=-6.99 TRINITY_DN15372_c0_g1_i10:208-1116(-)